MPELPEVEVTRQGLLPHLPGRRITAIVCSGMSLRFAIPETHLQRWILGNSFTTVERRAKYLLLRMADGSVLVIHLGMTGKLGIFPAAAPVGKHDHLLLTLDSGRQLRFNDSRRFGCILVWPAASALEEEKNFSAGLGVEPLGDSFNATVLAGIAAGRSVAVKNLLMDSHRIAGIGNIYANETLFQARIHPATPACALNMPQWRRICRECRKILKRAIAAGGSTIADFIDSNGQPGYFQLQLNVYDKAGKPCLVCGRKIEKTTLGGRATYFCPRCQLINRAIKAKSR